MARCERAAMQSEKERTRRRPRQDRPRADQEGQTAAQEAERIRTGTRQSDPQQPEAAQIAEASQPQQSRRPTGQSDCQP